MEAPAAGGEYAVVAPAPDLTRKVIANARIELVVADTEAVVRRIEGLMNEFGGYVSNANLYKGSYGGADLLRGTLTLRVPAESLETTMDALEEMALDTRSRSVDRQDVTDQYSDVEAQLRNLEATENELRELMAEVRARPNATPEDILAVHRSLTEVRGQIEQLQGRKNVMDNQIALSTIEVTLTPDAATRPVVEEKWRPVAALVMRRGVGVCVAVHDLAIWVLVYRAHHAGAPDPLALIVWVVRALVQRRRQAKRTS